MKKRKWPVLLVAVCCLASLLCPVSAVVSPDDAFYVYDGAQVLTQETEQYILKASQELESKTGAQIVVVTIPSLEGEALEEYATDLFRQWGIGDSEKNNGLLLLCAVEDRQFRVEVGYGLEGDLPDGKTGRMQDTYIIPLLRENEFDAGIKNGYSAFLQEVAAVYDVSITGETAVSYEDEDDGDSPAIIICIIIAVVLSSLCRVFFLKKKDPHLAMVFWLAEAVQFVVFALVLHSLLNALWIISFSLTLSLGAGSGRRRYRTFYGGGSSFGGGSFGSGGFGGGGGFRGGGGRSGGGGSSRGF